MDRAQEADAMVEEVEEDDQGDSGASFSMDGSGAEDKELRYQWFPLRPSAVGEDDEDTGQVSYTASAPAQQSSSDRLQGVPHTWSDDDAKQTPPERSQPDGRDGPDLKRMPWVSSTYVGTQQTVAPPPPTLPQTLPQTNGTLGSRDSGSDTSVLSQPQNDIGNITPLDIITRSVPPVSKGASLINELKHRHAPQLNSDSDTESPVSKLLGPNFRAVQEVLNRLKQDRLTDSVSNDGNSASDQQSLREESLQSLTSTGSRGHGTSTERKKLPLAHQLDSQVKTRPSADATASSFEILSSRSLEMLHLLHTQRQQGDMHLGDGSRRSDTSNNVLESAMLSYRDPPEMIPTENTPLSGVQATVKSSQDHSSPSSTLSSITSARVAGVEYRPSSGSSSEKVSQRDSPHTVPPPLLQTSHKYSTEQHSQSSIDISLRSSQMAWGERSTTGTNMKELLYHKDRSASTGLPSRVRTPKEQLHELTPRSSIGSSFLPTTTAWSESKLSTSSTARELSADRPNAEVPGVIPADVLLPPGHTSSDLVHGTKVTPNVEARSSLVEKSNDSHRTTRPHTEPFQQGMDSDRSISSDNTDDLLTYEPVFEGDRQYLRMQRRTKRSGSKHRQPDAGDPHGNGLAVRVAGETESVTRLSGEEQPPSVLQGQKGLQGTPVDLNDSHIKALHWSLGAGTISPISFPSAAQLDSQLGKSSTPLGPASEHSSVHEAGVLQEQSLEGDDYTGQSEDQDGAPLKQRESHSTTEVSSSDEIYRPVLYRDASGNKENRPGESTFKTTSYGIYDIRRSSGPGSTNRRRKALGLEPNPTREAVSQEDSGLVYISGSSTPSLQDVRGRYLMREDNPTRRPTDYREEQPDQEYYKGSPEKKEEHRIPRTKGYEPEKQAEVLRSRQAREVLGERDFPDSHRGENTSREDRRSGRSHRRQERKASSEDVPVSGSSPEEGRGPRHHRSDKSRQLPEKYIDRTDPNGTSHSLSRGKRSASSGKSRPRYVEDGLAPGGARVEKTTASRKHHSETSGAKTGHSSRDKRDIRGSSSSRLDTNISKLSSLISRSLEESISSSSQTSTTSALRRPPSKGKRAKMSSSTSETSDVSEFFNYAFFEPRFRQSIGRKLRLRELLKSVKSRDISPIVRRSRDTTSSESTSAASSNDGGREERESVRSVDREPSPALTEPRQSEAVAEKQFFTTKPAAGPKCTCSRKVVMQETSSEATQHRRQEHDDRESRMLRKRDVGVNFPTPAVARHRSSSPDEAPRAQMEDASTQTDEVSSARKANRKTDSEPEKSRPKPVKSKRNIEEHGVISQPSPKKSDYPYILEQREKRRPKERLIASQNSPDHSVKTSSDSRNWTKEPAWFYPMEIKPQTEQRTATQLKTPSRTRDELRVDVFDSFVNSSSSLQKLSLQEAFLYARPQFVKRSQERVARIEQAAREKERRMMIAEATREENRKEAAEMKMKTTTASPKIKTRMKRGKCMQK